MNVLNLLLLTLFTIKSFAFCDPKINTNNIKKSNLNNGGKIWVVLVASSSGWSNYRHQANICHAYKIIRENGIPKENIITMMVDDIAYHPRNPTPGRIINRPNGPDVYKGVVIDYKGKDVTKDNFIKIITGKKKDMQSIGTGKVVEARGLFDKIFINFVDHGTTGLLIFPSDNLYADELISALHSITAGSYRKVLLYIEACKSGSMFNGLLGEDKGVLAITSAGPRENSYGCYCGSQQSGPYHTCLGGFFSVTWLEHLDRMVFESYASGKTIYNNFNMIRTNVISSNVMLYGDLTIGHEMLSSFIGNRPNAATISKNPNTLINYSDKVIMSSRDVHKNTMYQLLENGNLTILEKLKLKAELRLNKEMRLIIDSVFEKIYSKIVKARPDIQDKIGDFNEPQFLVLELDMFPCYRNILDKITESCFSLSRNPYLLDRLTIFANLCVVDKKIHQMVGKLVDKSCLHIPKHIHNVF